MRWATTIARVPEVVAGYLGVDLADAFCQSSSGHLSQAGVGDRTIDHFMGQQAKEMRPRYQRLLPKERRKAPGRLDCWSVCPLSAKDADGEDNRCATGCRG